MAAQFLNEGDTALIVQFGDTIDRDLSERVLWLSQRIRAQEIPGVTGLIPTFRSLLVRYDPLTTSGEALGIRLRGLLHAGAGQGMRPRRWTIPVCYERDYAPDLDAVALASGLRPAQVVERHAGTCFHVYMLGFLPGCPYMGDLPGALALPRRDNPRTRVARGSVAIASGLTTIYPVESPGGWHLIGSTPIRLFDAHSARPALFQPGDQVRFTPVGARDYARIEQAVAAGTYEPACEPAEP